MFASNMTLYTKGRIAFGVYISLFYGHRTYYSLGMEPKNETVIMFVINTSVWISRNGSVSWNSSTTHRKYIIREVRVIDITSSDDLLTQDRWVSTGTMLTHFVGSHIIRFMVVLLRTFFNEISCGKTQCGCNLVWVHKGTTMWQRSVWCD